MEHTWTAVPVRIGLLVTLFSFPNNFNRYEKLSHIMFRNFIVTLLQNSRNFIHVFIFPGNISCNFLYIKTISYGSTLPKNCKLVSSHLGNTEKYKSPEVYFTLHKKCSFLLRISSVNVTSSVENLLDTQTGWEALPWYHTPDEFGLKNRINNTMSNNIGVVWLSLDSDSKLVWESGRQPSSRWKRYIFDR